MQGVDRTLVVPPINIAEYERQKAERAASERVAEHTGHPEFVIADEIADTLTHHRRQHGRHVEPFTTAERLLIADIVKLHIG